MFRGLLGRRGALFAALAVLATAVLAAGCEPSASGSDPAGEPESPSSAAPPKAQVTLGPGVDWRTWAESGREALARDNPALFQELSAMKPATTRGGHLRFLSTALARPEAAPWLVARLAARSDPAPVRRALAEALPFTKGPFAEAVGDLLAAEPSPEVRAELAATLEHAPPGISPGAMRSALLDPDETVRARALYTVASRSDGASYSDMITRALGQPEPGPKAAAIHACGVLRLTVAKPALDALVRGQGDHRAAALLALHRIDPEGARARSDLDALAADPALVHAVARIRGGAP